METFMNSLADLRIPFRPKPDNGRFAFKITEVFHNFKEEGQDFYLNYKATVPANEVCFDYNNGSYFLKEIPRKISEKIRESFADEIFVYPELSSQ